ncbi:MAG: hypothetical protein WCK02_07275 [Bacteroidota bacterium]
MKSKRNTLLTLLFLTIIIACQTSKKATVTRVPVINIKIDEKYNMNMRVDFKIDSAVIVGDTITLKVSFNKSTGADIFELIGNKMYLKSKPLKLQMFVSHIKSGEATEKKTTRTLRFNIAAIKPEFDAGELMFITIPGFSDKIPYKLK